MHNKKKPEVPERLAKDLAQRDQTPLDEHTLIKFQSISLRPGISKNFRFLVMQDGRLFYAANSKERPSDRNQIFNTPLPGHPNRILPPGSVIEISTKLKEVDFLGQDTYQAAPVRDGSLVIVTARQGDQVHEVWYSNVDNALTDLLCSITSDEPRERTPEQTHADLLDILHEQQQLSDRLKKEAPENSGEAGAPDP